MVLNRCCDYFPSLADPARRCSLVYKAVFVMLHLIYAAVLFLFDDDLIERTKRQPWYTAFLLLLFIATLVQYFVTSASSPGYVKDAKNAVNEKSATFRKASMSNKDSLLQAKNGSSDIDINTSQEAIILPESDSDVTPWTRLVLEMYLPGTSVRTLICFYCSVERPPRAKHCRECDKCVLQFDHHCLWLGTCIGQGNHCRFWWYLCEETALCIWTGIVSMMYLTTNIAKAWWKDAIMIILFFILAIYLISLLILLFFHSYLILTNQTTYEILRRRRIPYFRNIPGRLYPFSKGVCMNLFVFCCARSSKYTLERLPTAMELEEKSRPYTFFDFVTCRCC